ncbi:hypothetical protein [Sinomonas sp. ASV322]|uniref:hypothetical protein n=1 Tax=Sinomonas sp. ASV322 TaxID=3041920 RepID=UPI0027DD468F|nr:hypothetical protein [Sinomonas sp. ASV322]MDQ4504200.1 hypothetical protein [Sinomonas sp. ASV322]
MESNSYSPREALADADDARQLLAARLEPPRWYYVALGGQIFLLMVAIAWFAAPLVALAGSLCAVGGSALAAGAAKRIRAVTRFGTADFWAVAIVTAVLLAGAFCALLVRFEELPAWSGWLVAAVSGVAAGGAMVTRTRAVARRLAAGA